MANDESSTREDPKFTAEEYEILAHSPADSPNLVDDDLDAAANAPEGVVEGS